MGDEYFANLDHIESVENFKEGYESEAHCSDSEGSGVDMSRMKIQPSALVSNPVGRPPKKGESTGERLRWSLFGVSACVFDPSLHFILLLPYVKFFLPQPKAQAHLQTAMMTMTRIQRAKMKVTVQMTRL